MFLGNKRYIPGTSGLKKDDFGVLFKEYVKLGGQWGNFAFGGNEYECRDFFVEINPLNNKYYKKIKIPIDNTC